MDERPFWNLIGLSKQRVLEFIAERELEPPTRGQPFSHHKMRWCWSLFIYGTFQLLYFLVLSLNALKTRLATIKRGCYTTCTTSSAIWSAYNMGAHYSETRTLSSLMARNSQFSLLIILSLMLNYYSVKKKRHIVNIVVVATWPQSPLSFSLNSRNEQWQLESKIRGKNGMTNLIWLKMGLAITVSMDLKTN